MGSRLPGAGKRAREQDFESLGCQQASAHTHAGARARAHTCTRARAHACTQGTRPCKKKKKQAPEAPVKLQEYLFEAKRVIG